MSSINTIQRRSFAPHAQHLLRTAREAIAHGLRNGTASEPSLSAQPPELREPGASFVTLELNDDLRGCIGTLEAHRPLIQDVASNAYSAAFRDPRFTPLSETEFLHVSLHISILHPAEPMYFESEAQLLQQIRPGIDGLILEAGPRRGTFLPSVWEALPEPRAFLQQLKRKAGLTADYWSDQVRVWRYTTESIREAV